jgi:hypothetical protein
MPIQASAGGSGGVSEEKAGAEAAADADAAKAAEAAKEDAEDEGVSYLRLDTL